MARQLVLAQQELDKMRLRNKVRQQEARLKAAEEKALLRAQGGQRAGAGRKRKQPGSDAAQPVPLTDADLQGVAKLTGLKKVMRKTVRGLMRGEGSLQKLRVDPSPKLRQAAVAVMRTALENSAGRHGKAFWSEMEVECRMTKAQLKKLMSPVGQRKLEKQ